MIRQYFAHRRRGRGGCNPLGVGVIAVGAIFYIQNEGWWRDRSGAAVMAIQRPAKPASEGFSIYIGRPSPTVTCPSGR